jgi:hypothetical protein
MLAASLFVSRYTAIAVGESPDVGLTNSERDMSSVRELIAVQTT